jgi:hypothetical protein
MYQMAEWASRGSEDEDRDGLRNVGFFTAQPFDPADSPRELHHIQSSGKQQISIHRGLFEENQQSKLQLFHDGVMKTD